MKDPVLEHQWNVVGRSTDLPEGKIVTVRLLDEEVVLWRAGNEIMAWDNLCIHRGTRLSLGEIKNGCVVCPYHGWTYNTEGKCVYIPAHPEQIPPDKASVKKYHVEEKYGWIWVSLDIPAKPIHAFDEWEDETFRKIHCGPYYFKASMPRAFEGSIDVAHLSILHKGYLGDEDHAEIGPYKVIETDDGLVAANIPIWQPNPDGTGLGRTVNYTYKIYNPTTGYMCKMDENDPRKFSLFYTVTPVSKYESIMWMWMNMNYGHDKSEEELRQFQDLVTSQDIPIAESQRPELLPLDLQEELHLRSDLTSIHYRKWLKQLGVTFGTD